MLWTCLMFEILLTAPFGYNKGNLNTHTHTPSDAWLCMKRTLFESRRRPSPSFYNDSSIEKPDICHKFNNKSAMVEVLLLPSQTITQQ